MWTVSDLKGSLLYLRPQIVIGPASIIQHHTCGEPAVDASLIPLQDLLLSHHFSFKLGHSVGSSGAVEGRMGGEIGVC